MDFRDSQEASVNMATDAIDAVQAAHGTQRRHAAARHGGAQAQADARGDSKAVKPQPYPVEVDHSRDALLTDFGKDTLNDRYLLPGESYQDLFARVASAYADDAGARPAALRLYLEAVVHAGDAGAVERRHRARPADLAATSTRSTTASKASSTPGTRTSGSPRAAAASAPIGATCAASASRSASTARPAASSPSSG